MTPVELSRTVLRAVRRAVDQGELRVAVPERVLVTVPGPGGCGDYATNVALQLARPAGQTPLRVAEILRPHLVGEDGVADVVVTGPGFINFSLRGAGTAALVEEILRLGARYGFSDRLSGQVVQLHCPHEVRAVVVMDVVARLLRSQAARVRTSCVASPEEGWVGVLGVRVDASGRPGAPAPLDVNVRPVPAPSDPLPLGRDAARWALLHPAAHDRPRIDGEHLVQREANPLFRVRYAHARTRALTRNATALGFTSEPGDPGSTRDARPPAAQPGTSALGFTSDPGDPGDPGPTPEAQAQAQALTSALADHPRILAASAEHRAPDRLARHLVTVADAALAFLPAVLPRGAEKPLAAHRARLALAEAAGAVLAGGLSLLGIDAPEHL
ncbi:arginyl tRNA synthetase [Streptomyces davaonensis JCM 4913]|uniref:arginine--tRNA ligase n=1 Tax=Streptomyces davaonensis (strain DSM 101723 / JCM 4913 / KCC S-0913 / 768) TaxID=1214101 RepID=K4R421_STRDJ|nr:DALR anticodon-binding domain-containing protein [Streptomyces davaonensis]CCK27439.1 arginyl tRNA synthetase [Streptomyces davaonensis JCM 4913]